MPRSAPKLKGGRPAFEPTDDHRKVVALLSGVGTNRDVIAQVIGVSRRTLFNHFPHELEHGKEISNARVTQTLFQMACSGRVPAATIFWQKAQAGWVEKQKIDVTSNDEPLTTIRVVYADADPNTADPAPGAETDS